MKTMTIIGGVVGILGFITAAIGAICIIIKFMTTSTDSTSFVNKYAALFWVLLVAGVIAIFAGAGILVFM
jgi:hypothetical protein